MGPSVAFFPFYFIKQISNAYYKANYVTALGPDVKLLVTVKVHMNDSILSGGSHVSGILEEDAILSG